MESWEGLQVATHDRAPSCNVWDDSDDTMRYSEMFSKNVH